MPPLLPWAQTALAEVIFLAEEASGRTRPAPDQPLLHSHASGHWRRPGSKLRKEGEWPHVGTAGACRLTTQQGKLVQAVTGGGASPWASRELLSLIWEISVMLSGALHHVYFLLFCGITREANPLPMCFLSHTKFHQCRTSFLSRMSKPTYSNHGFQNSGKCNCLNPKSCTRISAHMLCRAAENQLLIVWKSRICFPRPSTISAFKSPFPLPLQTIWLTTHKAWPFLKQANWEICVLLET